MPDESASPQRRFFPAEQYGVPRRFSVGTILIVTAAFAVVFGVLNVLGTPHELAAAIGVFLTLIGLSQALLFRGQNPRRASVISGASISMVALLAGLCIASLANGRLPNPGELLYFGIAAIMLGAMLGYVGGYLVASLFMIMDGVERCWFPRSRKATTAPTAAEFERHEQP